jgi:streptogramin lyase
VDEGVNSPCGDCNSECSFDINPQEQSTGTSGAPSRVNITTEQFVDGNPHIWIANSAENTLSRLNTETGCEEARYAVCADPSRTAVDIKGNGVVGCRGDGYVYKIAVSLETCIDKNENGTIETSSDLNGDCVIQPDEMIADDECIVWKAQPVTSGSPCARAAGIDAEGHVWVGMWNAQQLFQLSGETGEILRNHTIGMRPYGLAIDREGTIWVASREPNGVLLKVHPETGIVNSWTNPAGENYGLAVDPFNGVWVATGWATSGLARFDTVEETWQTYTNGGEATRGVAVRLNSDEDGLVTGATVYAAQYAGSCGTNQYVTAIDAETGALLPTIDVGSGMGPVGVAIDSQGHLWTVNQCDNSASKIDTASGEIMGSFPVGNGPYTYSDMTGYALKTITTVSSDYIKRLRGWESGETYWESLTLDAEFPSELTSITVAFRCGNSLEELNASEWFGPFGPYPADGPTPLPIEQTGYYLEVRVTLASKSTSSFPVLNGLSVKASQK